MQFHSFIDGQSFYSGMCPFCQFQEAQGSSANTEALNLLAKVRQQISQLHSNFTLQLNFSGKVKTNFNSLAVKLRDLFTETMLGEFI